MLTRSMIATIRFYQAGISPLRPPTCRFQPTCSAYGLEAIERYGAGRGFVVAGEAPAAVPSVLPRWLGSGAVTNDADSRALPADRLKLKADFMEKRVLIAVFMMSIVILVSNLLFPPSLHLNSRRSPRATLLRRRARRPCCPRSPSVPADSVRGNHPTSALRVFHPGRRAATGHSSRIRVTRAAGPAGAAGTGWRNAARQPAGGGGKQPEPGFPALSGERSHPGVEAGDAPRSCASPTGAMVPEPRLCTPSARIAIRSG